MNRAHILGFPNRLPRIEGDDVALHLLKFHMHIHRLRIELPDDCLMKMFMASLEGKARSWYEKLSFGILYSLKDFHLVFFERYKVSYPYLLLVEDCCKYVESLISIWKIFIVMRSLWMKNFRSLV